MKTFPSIVAFLMLCSVAQAQYLIPTRPDPDPALAAAREKAFQPWIPDTCAEKGKLWKKLSSSCIPVFNEYKGDLCRSIYILNPGTGYCSLDGLSDKDLWDMQNKKLKIGDELVSATTYTNVGGVLVHWALWAPATKSHLIKDKMRLNGILPAQVSLTPPDKPALAQ